MALEVPAVIGTSVNLLAFTMWFPIRQRTKPPPVCINYSERSAHCRSTSEELREGITNLVKVDQLITRVIHGCPIATQDWVDNWVARPLCCELRERSPTLDPLLTAVVDHVASRIRSSYIGRAQFQRETRWLSEHEDVAPSVWPDASVRGPRQGKWKMAEHLRRDELRIHDLVQFVREQRPHVRATARLELRKDPSVFGDECAAASGQLRTFLEQVRRRELPLELEDI